jgi:hypothetical protein
MNAPEQGTGKAPKASSAPGPESSSVLSLSVERSSLFKLPRELRDYIYEYAFSSPHLFAITKDEGIPEPALLITCKIIRDEAIMLFYGRKRLMLDIHSYDPAVVLLWDLKKTQLVRSHGPAYVCPPYLHAGPKKWKNLMRMLELRQPGRISSLTAGAPSSPGYREELHSIEGLFRIVDEMQSKPWEAVEAMLDMLRPGLARLHQEWAL